MEVHFTKEEIDAIKFYLGDKKIVQDNVYRGGGKAYQTINALLNYGVRNEMDKALEGKVVEIYDVQHLKSYLELIKLVFGAAVKYRNATNSPNKTSYRVDRLSSFQEFQSHNGVIEGFFSTCKSGLLPQYANSKRDVVLLEVVRDDFVPYLDFEDILKDFYSKPDEAEILVPFGTRILETKEIDLTDDEKRIYHDSEGKPPRGKWIIYLGQGQYKSLDPVCEQQYFDYITDEQVVSTIIEKMKMLSSKQTLTADEIAFYKDWKEKVIRYINSRACATLKEYDIADVPYTKK